MKIKIFVAIALVIFIVAIGAILAAGLIQKNTHATPGITSLAPDTSTIVDTKKTTQQSITSIAAAANDTVQPQANTQTNTQPQPVPQPMRRTRAS